MIEVLTTISYTIELRFDVPEAVLYEVRERFREKQTKIEIVKYLRDALARNIGGLTIKPSLRDCVHIHDVLASLPRN